MKESSRGCIVLDVGTVCTLMACDRHPGQNDVVYIEQSVNVEALRRQGVRLARILGVPFIEIGEVVRAAQEKVPYAGSGNDR